MTDTEVNLDALAAGPRKASGDSGSIEQHSLKDVMAYADRKAAKNAIDSRGRPRLHMSKMNPPGAV